MSDYPEHEKLAAPRRMGRSEVRTGDLSQELGLFLDWLQSQRYVVAKWGCPHGRVPYSDCNEKWCRSKDNDEVLWPNHDPIQDILAEYFDIDYQALQEEKHAMLEEIRQYD